MYGMFMSIWYKYTYLYTHTHTHTHTHITYIYTSSIILFLLLRTFSVVKNFSRTFTTLKGI